MEYIKDFDFTIEKSMQPFKDTIYLKGILHLLLVLYSGLFAPELPRQVLFLFKNQYFKLFIFSLILWTSQFSPSTAILISIAFMISMNAVNDRPLWEFLEDVGPVQQDVKGNAPVSSTQSVEALKVLAEASGSIGASSPADIATIANIVAANVTTEAGATALKQLAEQAAVPNQGDPKKIEEAITKVIESIPPPVSSTQSVEALKVLVEASGSPAASSPVDIATITNIVAANVTTEAGANALKQLAEQAAVPNQGDPKKIEEAITKVIESIPTPVSSQQSVEALKVLAQASDSKSASSPADIATIANIVGVNVTTNAGETALKQLAEQAVVPAQGDPKRVDEAIIKVIESIPPVVKGDVPVSSQQSVEALKVLAQASDSKSASSPADIAGIANIVAANVTTEAGATALKQLAEQAIAPNQGDPKKIEEAITRVIQSIPSGAVSLVTPPAPPAAPTSEGCYPIRRYDISKVISSKPSDNSSNAVYEDYQAWVK
jgi:uncharacterized protein YegL